MAKMETSTPINSPIRKKHSLVQKFVPVDESLGDIESEIQSRRLEAINKSTEARRRLSAAPLLAGYTASQLSQHCKDVIKLSTENKINSKNAFNFWLIDVMAAMAKKTDSEINKNFQVASCTLDASVKIYGYRVDAIHTDCLKMAGGFGKEAAQAIDGDAGEDEENEKGEEFSAKPKAKKKRKKLTIVPPESLNAKSEAEILLDVVPSQNFLNRKVDGNDLLVKIPKYDDGSLLVLDSDYPCWPYDENGDSVPKLESHEMVDQENLKSLISFPRFSKDEEALCSAYRNFEFGKSRRDGEDSDEDFQTSQNSGRFEFDANASVHDVSIEEEPEGQRKRIEIPAGGFDSDEEISVRPEKQKKKKSLDLTISEMKNRISINPSEYSMFDEKFFKAWPGPAHWKVKPPRKPLEEFANGEDLSKPVASKRTRKGKIKSHAGLFDVLEDVLEKNLTESEKTTLFKSTMLNWTPENTTMPKDLKCRSINLFSLYHIPSFAVACRSTDSAQMSDHSAGEEEEGEKGEAEEVEEEEEIEYCSASILHDGNQEFDRREDPEPNLMGAGEEAWDSANMVEAPNRIERIHVSNFKRRKHVDINHLKRGLWKVLTNSETETDKLGKMEEAVEFRELIKLYPGKFSKNFDCLLSAPLVFNALLHLTNEKCLILTQNKSKNFNFLISQ